MPYQTRSLIGLLCLFCLTNLALGQTSKPAKAKAKPVAAGPRRLAFAEAQTLLAEAREGNLEKRVSRDMVTYTRTRLPNGQVLELNYPVTANQPVKGKVPRTSLVPGYGVLYESEAAYNDATRPRHALEDLIPDGRAFIASVPQLVARLEKRLRTRLDYSRASLRRLDALVASYRSTHADSPTIDATLFQELTAYYGETLRRALNAEWQATEERVGKTQFIQLEPNLRFTAPGALRSQLLKPWSSILNALYEETNRSGSVTQAFDAESANR